MSHSIPTNRRLFATDSFRWVAIAAAIAIVVGMLDVLSKWLITRSLGPGGSQNAIQIGGNFVELDYTRNSGVAFGLLSGSSNVAGALVGLLIVPLILGLFIFAGRGPLWSVAAGLVLGGAIGNVVDRIGDGTVTDFISVGRWPSFNLADAAISVGALVLIGLSFRNRDSNRTERTR